MEKHEKKQKRCIRGRIVKSIAVALFAVLLTATAVYKPGFTWGRTGGTGKDTVTPISFTVHSKDPNAAARLSMPARRIF